MNDAPGVEISLQVNGRDRSVSRGRTLLGLLHDLGLEPGLVVVERNREILSREGHGEVVLESGDVIEIVHFVGGG